MKTRAFKAFRQKIDTLSIKKAEKRLKTDTLSTILAFSRHKNAAFSKGKKGKSKIAIRK